MRREVVQQGRSKLCTGKTGIIHTLLSQCLWEYPNDKWCPSNTVPHLECPPGFPECSPAGMQQKGSHWQVTFNNVDSLHQQQPCLGQLSSGNPYSAVPWGMSCPSDPLMDAMGLLGLYSNSSGPNQGSSAVSQLEKLLLFLHILKNTK